MYASAYQFTSSTDTVGGLSPLSDSEASQLIEVEVWDCVDSIGNALRDMTQGFLVFVHTDQTFVDITNALKGAEATTKDFVAAADGVVPGVSDKMSESIFPLGFEPCILQYDYSQ